MAVNISTGNDLKIRVAHAPSLADFGWHVRHLPWHVRHFDRKRVARVPLFTVKLLFLKQKILIGHQIATSTFLNPLFLLAKTRVCTGVRGVCTFYEDICPNWAAKTIW